MKIQGLHKKLLLLMVLYAITQVNPMILIANNTYPTITTQERPLQAVLEELGEKYQVFFSYEPKLVRDIYVDFALKPSESLERAVNRLLQKTNFTFDLVSEKYIVVYKNNKDGQKRAKKIRKKIKQIRKLEHGGDLSIRRNSKDPRRWATNILSSVKPSQPAIRVSGTLTDENGAPLIGATVLIKGSISGSVTDLDGKYAIEVPDENAVLVFSYTGYLPQEVVVGSQTTIDLQMAVDVENLSEVIVVGYGTQKKVSITGSVATVESEALTQVPTANVTESLAGRLAGLIVDQNSGRPGSNTASISIRGFGANNVGATNARAAQNEAALVIVDGMQRDFSQLDPFEIESITILKDAAAAVYGIRGASGVILVTTKKGKVGKPVISYNGSFTSQDVKFPEFATWQQYLQGVANHGDRDNADTAIGEGVLTPEREAALAAGDTGTDWYDAMTRDFTPMQQHNLNVSGGTEDVKYFASFGYLNEGTIWNTGDFGYERFNGSLNLDLKANEYLSSNIILGWRKELRSSTVVNDFSYLSFAVPAYPSSHPDPNFLPNVSQNNPFSPLVATNRDQGGYNDVASDVLNGSIDLRFKVPGIDGLELIAFGGINQTNTNTERLTRAYDLWFNNGTDYVGPFAGIGTNQLAQTNAKFSRFTTNFRANYNKTFGNHSLNVLALWEGIKETNENFNATTSALLSPAVPFLFSSNGEPTVNGRGTEYGRSGYVARINYDYKSKYLLEFSVRRDGSSYFPEDSRFGWFPGVSVGWNIHLEDFMANSSISRLKLKASASQLGNDGANGYDYIPGLGILVGGSNSLDGYVFDNGYQTAIRTLGIANPAITWQRSNLYNIGIEASFMQNKLTFEFDAFYRDRFDLLALDVNNVLIPGTSGAAQPLQNLESRTNRGVEAIVGYRTTLSKDATLNITGNASWSREKYGDYVEPDDFGDDDLNRISKRSGQWVNRTFGYVYDGFFNSQAEIDDATIDYSGGAGNTNFKPGDLKVADVNGDGVINNLDQVLIGKNGTPEIQFGLNTQLNWKNFDLTVFFQGSTGFGRNFSNTERTMMIGNAGALTPFAYVMDNIWNPENGGEGALFPVDGLNNNQLVMDEYWRDITFIRLKNLVAGYTLPRDVVSKIGMSNLRVSVNAWNLLTFDNLGIFPFDPESTGRTAYPVPARYTFSIQASF